MCADKDQAARIARGSPDIERSEFDGYLFEQESGQWQAEAAGLVIGGGLSLERALLQIAEHGAGRPIWIVWRGKPAELLKASA